MAGDEEDKAGRARALEVLRGPKGSVSAAARAWGISRPLMYLRAESDPELAAAMGRGPAAAPPPVVASPAATPPAAVPAGPRASTQEELAQATGGSRAAVQGWIAAGHIPAMPGGGWVVDDVLALLRARGIEPGRNGRPRALHRAAGALSGGASPTRPPGGPAASGGLPAAPGVAPSAAPSPGAPGAGPLFDAAAPPGPNDSAEALVWKEALAKAQQAWAKAQKDGLALQREAGLLVDRVVVAAEVKRAIALARTKLLALPGALCQALAVEQDPRAVDRLLDERIRGVLDELVRESGGGHLREPAPAATTPPAAPGSAPAAPEASSAT